MVGVAQKTPRIKRSVPLGLAHRGKERFHSVIRQSGVDQIAIASYDINPGRSSTFSVGGLIAQRFERYSIPSGARNIVRYVASANSTALGRVYMYANYDPHDPPPETEDEFADRADSVQSNVWEDLALHLRASDMGTSPKPVILQDTAQDKNLTDACTVHIGFFGWGTSDDSTLGQCYIEYDMRLHVQRPLPAINRSPANHLFATMANSQTVAGTSVTVNEWSTQSSRNGLGATIASGVISLSPGTYEIGFDLQIGNSIAPTGSLAYEAQLVVAGNILITSTSRSQFQHVSGNLDEIGLHSNNNHVTVLAGETVSVLLTSTAAAVGSIVGVASRLHIQRV